MWKERELLRGLNKTKLSDVKNRGQKEDRNCFKAFFFREAKEYI